VEVKLGRQINIIYVNVLLLLNMLDWTIEVCIFSIKKKIVDCQIKGLNAEILLSASTKLISACGQSGSVSM